MRKPILLNLAALITVLLAAGPSAAEQLAGRVSVIDGDTLELHGRRIRLFGIDAPEHDQTCHTADGKPWRCGTMAARAMDALTSGKTVHCTARDIDRYGRIVASCETDGYDLGSALVGQGLAVAYRKYSLDYVPAEDEAREADRGMWSGTFERPDTWRRNHPRQ